MWALECQNSEYADSDLVDEKQEGFRSKNYGLLRRFWFLKLEVCGEARMVAGGRKDNQLGSELNLTQGIAQGKEETIEGNYIN